MTDQQSISAFWDAWKAKKRNIGSVVTAIRFDNHPNRTNLFWTTGSMSITKDERITSTPPVVGTEVELVVLSANFASLPSYSRHFFDVPRMRLDSVLAQVPAGKFAFMHQPIAPWAIRLPRVAQHPIGVIGSETRTIYRRTSSGWTEVSSETFDVEGGAIFGVPTEGGYYDSAVTGGFSEESEDYKATIQCEASASSNFIPLPDLTVIEKRWPWDDSWGVMTDGLAASLADFLGAQNAGAPGQWSGSLSLAYNFS